MSLKNWEKTPTFDNLWIKKIIIWSHQILQQNTQVSSQAPHLGQDVAQKQEEEFRKKAAKVSGEKKKNGQVLLDLKTAPFLSGFFRVFLVSPSLSLFFTSQKDGKRKWWPSQAAEEAKEVGPTQRKSGFWIDPFSG